MSGWPVATLSDISHGKGQYGVGLSSREWVSGDPRYIRITDIDENGCLNSNRVAPDGDEGSWAKALLNPGDLLFARSGATVGKAYLHSDGSQPAVYAGYLIKFELDLDRAVPEYVFRYTQSLQYWRWIANSQRVVAQPNINAQQYAALPIPLPPIEEQRRIAAILDHADALRAKRREALARLDELTQSIFVDMFGDPALNPRGWTVAELGSLADKFSDGPFGSNLKSSHYVDEGVRVIRLQNIGVGEFVDKDRAYVAEDHYSTLSHHDCRPGDVLVGTLGEPNLRACVQPEWLQIALNKADCVQVRPKIGTSNAEFLVGLLNQKSTEKMAHALVLGQTRARISMGRLRGLKVPVPPFELQLEYAERVQGIGRLKFHHQAALAELDALFSSLQSRAFRGEL
ncbi:restriction endonuclease subunit S [Rhodococcus sp. SJ-2]